MLKRLIAVCISCIFITPVLGGDAPQTLSQCPMSERESGIAALLLAHPEQSRETLACDPHLVEFARMRARDMAERDYFGHVTPDRIGPNELLRASGYEMPKYYVGGIANSIESILAGEADPSKVWKLLLSSSTHRKHLLGFDDMYLKQQKFGVGYFHKPASKYAHYWVVVIVEAGTDERPMTCTPAPPVCIVH